MNYSKYILIQIFCFLFFSLFVACGNGNDIVSSRYINLGNEGITQGNDYLFENLIDSLSNKDKKGYNIFLSIRYSDLCNVVSLPLEIEYGSVNSDTISKKSVGLNLFDDKGKPIGKGNFGLYEETQSIISDILVDDYFFISLSCKQPSISGINSIGILIKE